MGVSVTFPLSYSRFRHSSYCIPILVRGFPGSSKDKRPVLLSWSTLNLDTSFPSQKHTLPFIAVGCQPTPLKRFDSKRLRESVDRKFDGTSLLCATSSTTVEEFTRCTRVDSTRQPTLTGPSDLEHFVLVPSSKFQNFKLRERSERN